MRGKSQFRTIRALVIVVFLAEVILWIPSAWSGIAAPAETPVYVQEFRQTGVSVDYPDLGRFVSSLLKLRLSSVPSIRIPNLSDQPPCDTESSSRSQATRPDQSGDRGQAIPKYYTIRGSLDFHSETKGSGAEVLISYELLKTEACQQKALYHSTDIFSLTDALEKLNSLADDLASRVGEDLLNRLPVSLYMVTVEGGKKADAEMGEVLTKFLKHRLSDEIDLKVQLHDSEPSDSRAEYQLKGGLRFFEMRGSQMVEADFQIVSKDNRVYSLAPKRSTIHRTKHDLTQFLVDTADSTVNQLNDIRYARQAGIEDIPSSDSSALIKKANAALCARAFEVQYGCSPAPKAALAALNKMRHEDLGFEGLQLIGRADSMIGNSSGASDSFEEALATLDMQQTEPRMQLLKDSADAWYDSKDYAKAAGRYAEYFHLVQQHQQQVPDLWHAMPESSVRLAHSLTLNDKRIDAIDSIFESQRALGSSEELRGELNGILDEMPPSDLEQAILRLKGNLDSQDPILATGLVKLANFYYYEQQNTEKAEPLYQTALAIQEKVLDADDPNLALTKNSLANLFYTEYRYADAVTLYKSALETLENPSRPNEQLQSTVLGNLGGLYESKSEYLDAAAFNKRALDLAQKIFGADDKRVSQLRMDLAWDYVEAGKFDEAGELYRSEVAQQTARGVEDETLANALRGLGVYYSYIGRYFEEKTLEAHALAIYEKILTHENSRLASAYSNLGGSYYDLGRYADAENCFLQDLEIQKRIPNNNLFLAETYFSIAHVYREQARYREAESYYIQAQKLIESTVGENSRDMALVLRGWGVLYGFENRTKEAEVNLKQALEIIQKALGPDHWRSARTLNDLGRIYVAQGKFQDAELFFNRALSIWNKAGVPDHPDTAESLNGLALIREKEGEIDVAESLCDRALTIREAALGSQHPDYAKSLETLAAIKTDRGDLVAALTLYKRSLVIYEKTLGLDHPYVATTLESSAALLRQMGQTREAQQFEKRAIGIRAKYAR
jgi:tetratricopeptide (TPR) repeat protein